MSVIKWIKTAANISTGGLSSLYLYGGLFVAGAAAFATASVWHGAQVKDVRETAYKAGRDADAEADARTRAHDALAYAERAIALSNELNGARNAHQDALQRLSKARTRAADSGRRVRDAADPAGGDLDQRIAAAECPVVRSFGADAFRTAVACRGNLAEIGLGPGGLVEASASEHYQASRADALIRFSMPRSPFTKPVEKLP
jgi:hypothetical protein